MPLISKCMCQRDANSIGLNPYILPFYIGSPIKIGRCQASCRLNIEKISCLPQHLLMTSDGFFFVCPFSAMRNCCSFIDKIKPADPQRQYLRFLSRQLFFLVNYSSCLKPLHQCASNFLKSQSSVPGEKPLPPGRPDDGFQGFQYLFGHVCLPGLQSQYRYEDAHCCTIGKTFLPIFGHCSSRQRDVPGIPADISWSGTATQNKGCRC